MRTVSIPPRLADLLSPLQGWKRYYDHIEVNEVMKYADYTNVMTYDQVSGVSEYTGHHTPWRMVHKEDIQGNALSSNSPG